MATEPSPNPGVKPDDNNPTPDPGVKPGNPEPSPDPGVKPDNPGDGVDPKPGEPVVPTVTFNGYEVPKPVHDELRKNSFEEGKRKALKELEEQGKIRTEDETKEIQFVKDFYKMLGKKYSPDKLPSKEELDQMLEQRQQLLTGDLQNKLKEANEKVEKAELSAKDEVNEWRGKFIFSEAYKIISGLTSGDLTGNKEGEQKPIFHTKWFEKATRDFLDNYRLTYNEEKQIVVVDKDGAVQFNSSGNPMTVKDAILQYAKSPDTDCYKAAAPVSTKSTPSNKWEDRLTNNRQRQPLNVNRQSARSPGRPSR